MPKAKAKAPAPRKRPAKTPAPEAAAAPVAPAPQPAPAPAPGAGLFGDLGPVSPLLCRITQKELAAALGVAPKTIWEWGKERAFPPAAVDGYVVRDVLAWLAQQMLERGGATDGEKLTLKEKNLQLDNELKRLKRDQISGKLIAKAPLRDEWEVISAILSNRLQAVGAAFGPACMSRILQTLEEAKIAIERTLSGEEETAADDL